MKRIVAILCLLALCCSFCACAAAPEEPEDDGPSLSQAAANKGKKDEDAAPSNPPQAAEPQPEETPADAPLYEGDTFTLSIREITDRLNTIGAALCPGMTAHLEASEWIATTQLRYNGVPFCELTYYNTDDYLNNPYPDRAMNEDMLDLREVRYINLMDFLNQTHPENSFWAIAMTFDPQITQAQAQELADFLTETRSEYWESYLVTAVNGIGYGHAYPVNQMEYSGSIVIRAGCTSPELCVHAVEYEFNQDGTPYGRCSKCNQLVFPAQNGKYLADMAVVSDSNSSSGTDVVAGDWEDPAGAKYWNALKFWVIDKEGWSNTEYIEYALDQEYSTLCGTIASSEESNPGTRLWIEVYLDGRLIYTSSKIGYTDTLNYMVDISGGSKVRIVCGTDTAVHGHCLVTAIVY